MMGEKVLWWQALKGDVDETLLIVFPRSIEMARHAFESHWATSDTTKSQYIYYL